MRDHNLLKKALESGKTVSRKSRNKIQPARSSVGSPDGSPANSAASSKANSRAASRVVSRAGSRQVSDNEDEYDIASVASDEDNKGYELDPNQPWVDNLIARIAELQVRKGTSAKGREESMTAYESLIRHHFAGEEVESRASDIIPALTRSIRTGGAEEQAIAIKALATTILTYPSQTIFSEVYQPLQDACHHADESSKVEALRAIPLALKYGGGSAHSAEQVLEFLLEIIESDGQSIDSFDSCAVVNAALRAWGYVASYMGDLRPQSERALEALVEQLDSGDVDVIISAALNIALLLENCRFFEGQEESADVEDNELQYGTHRAVARLQEILRDAGSRGVTSRERRKLKASLTDVISSLDKDVGPGFREARPSNPHKNKKNKKKDEDEEEGDDFFESSGKDSQRDNSWRDGGFTNSFRVYDRILVIDTWVLQARIEFLKQVLGGGLVAHFMENTHMTDTVLDQSQVEQFSSQDVREREWMNKVQERASNAITSRDEEEEPDVIVQSRNET